ncbi:MAG: hypothetical protein ACI37T_04755 [Candidatus Gastranaerophilaceae bacterium]
MSIKSRLQKNREAKSFGFSDNVRTDLLKIFQEHTELSSMTVYSYNKITGEKDGKSSKLAIGFNSYEDYYEEVSKLLEISGNSSENPHVIINIQNIIVNIYLPPLTVNEPILFFSRRKNKKSENILSNKLISNEMVSYFTNCLAKRANIFIAGDASVDKSSIMNAIADLVTPDKKIIVCDLNKKINIDKPCVGRFSKQILKSEIFFDYDNIFCTDVENEEFTDIFKLIISGFCGFVVSFSVKKDIDMLSAIRNIILLSNTNLFEENADFMTTSSMDIIVNVENDLNGNAQILKVSETSKNKLGEISLKDIFVWNEYSKAHVSAGNNSKYLCTEYMQELYKHHYSDNKMFEQFIPSQYLQSKKEIFIKDIENDSSEIQNITNQNLESRKTKLGKLKEKIRQFKTERLNQTEQQENNVEKPTLHENTVNEDINILNPNLEKDIQFEKTEIQKEELIEQPVENGIIPVFSNYTNNPIEKTEDVEEIENIEVQKEDILENPNNAVIPDIISDTGFIDVKSYFKNEENPISQVEQEIPEEAQNNIQNMIIEENIQEIQEDEEVKNEPEILEQTDQIEANELIEEEENSEISETEKDFENNENEEYNGRIDVEQIDLVDEDSNQGVLASEIDDFSEEEIIQTPKIRNILEEDNDEQEESSLPIDEQLISEQKEINNSFELFTEKYQEEFKEEIEEEKKPKDPELFKEIDYIDIDNYDVADIPDEDI